MGTLVGEAGAAEAEELDYYRRAVAADPTCRDAHLSLGCAHARERRYDEALASFREVWCDLVP